MLNPTQGNGQYRFTNLDYTSGLPITQINHFAEDSKGYIWMGSTNGLAMFDGLEFKYFEPGVVDNNTIIGSEIAGINVDKWGKVWVTFHDGGLSIYDHLTQKFFSKAYKESDGQDFPRYAIIDLLIDEEREKVWMVSIREGLFELDMKTLESRLIKGFSRPRSIEQDPFNSSYFYLSADALHRVHKEDYKSQEISKEIFYELKSKDDMLYGHDWSDNALLFNPVDQSIKKYKHTTDNINRDALMVGSDIWLSHYDDIEIFRSGINKNDQLSNLWNPNRPPKGSHFYGMFEDKSGRIWIGTDEGVSVIIPEYQDLVDLEFLGKLRAFDMIKGNDEGTYYASSLYDDQIVKFNIKTRSSKVIRYSNGMDFSGPVEMVRQDDKIWVIGFRGVGFFTDDDNLLRPYDALNEYKYLNPQDLGDIIIDNDKNVWLGRNKSPFLIKIPYNGLPVDTVMIDGLGGDNHLKVTYYHDGAIWLGTDEGLCRFDLSTFNQSWFTYDEGQNEAFKSSIEDLAVDDLGHLWILSLQSGAFKCLYDKGKDELKVLRGYYQLDGLSNNRPWSVDVDDEGMVYFGSTSGISIYHPSIDRMIPLGKEYGFYNLSTRVEKIDDKLFILSNGIQYVETEKLQELRPSPSVFIEAIYIGDERLDLPSAKNVLTLSHNENNLTIEYKAIDIDHPRDIRYRYRMNQDENWRILGYSERKALFNRLSPGEYTFEVAAAGPDIEWGPTAEFRFRIKPPFWKSWWFIGMTVVGLGIIIYFVVRWRERQIKMIGDMKSKMSELENEALRAQMNPHFIFNSLNSIKSFIISNKKEEAADYLTTFAELIRTILRNSKEQFIPLSEEIKALNLYMEIENIRLNEKFNVVWDIDPNINIESYLVPPLAIQPFVENAIWHGFVHKEGKGELLLRVLKKENFLLFEITDNGIGREQSKIIEKRHFRKRSYGIAITKQRLGMKKDEEIEIEDLVDDNGLSLGTKVIVKVPMKLLT